MLLYQKNFNGTKMSAFEIGLSIGMITLIYITYELLKYEPLNKKQ